MNAFLAAWFVGAFVYGVHSYYTVRMSQARRACGISSELDDMVGVLERRGLLSFAVFFGAMLFPLSLAYDAVIQQRAREQLKGLEKKVEKAKQELFESNRELGDANVRLFIRWMRLHVAEDIEKGSSDGRFDGFANLTEEQIEDIVVAFRQQNGG